MVLFHLQSFGKSDPILSIILKESLLCGENALSMMIAIKTSPLSKLAPLSLAIQPSSDNFGWLKDYRDNLPAELLDHQINWSWRQSA